MVNGTVGPEYGLLVPVWNPVPPSFAETTINLNNSWVYPNAVLHLMPLNPSLSYNLSLQSHGRPVALSSVTCFFASA